MTDKCARISRELLLNFCFSHFIYSMFLKVSMMWWSRNWDCPRLVWGYLSRENFILRLRTSITKFTSPRTCISAVLLPDWLKMSFLKLVPNTTSPEHDDQANGVLHWRGPVDPWHVQVSRGRKNTYRPSPICCSVPQFTPTLIIFRLHRRFILKEFWLLKLYCQEVCVALNCSYHLQEFCCLTQIHFPDSKLMDKYPINWWVWFSYWGE